MWLPAAKQIPSNYPKLWILPFSTNLASSLFKTSSKWPKLFFDISVEKIHVYFPKWNHIFIVSLTHEAFYYNSMIYSNTSSNSYFFHFLSTLAGEEILSRCDADDLLIFAPTSLRLWIDESLMVCVGKIIWHCTGLFMED